MSTKRDNPLEAAKLGADGTPTESNSARAQVDQVLAEARAALPKGVPADSPLAKMTRDQLLSEGNRMEMPLGPLMTPDELRLVLECWRLRIVKAPVASTPVGARPHEKPPDVPMQPLPPKQRKIRGVPETQTGKWRVINAKEFNGQHRPVSVGGNMTTLRNGAIIELRHYDEATIRSIVEQGVELEPVEPDDED